MDISNDTNMVSYDMIQIINWGWWNIRDGSWLQLTDTVCFLPGPNCSWKDWRMLWCYQRTTQMCWRISMAAQPMWALRSCRRRRRATQASQRMCGAWAWCCTPCWWAGTPFMTPSPSPSSARSAVATSTFPTPSRPRPAASFAVSCAVTQPRGSLPAKFSPTLGFDPSLRCTSRPIANIPSCRLCLKSACQARDHLTGSRCLRHRVVFVVCFFFVGCHWCLIITDIYMLLRKPESQIQMV